MELATALAGQTVLADIRQIGINSNHWYAVGWATDVKSGQVISLQAHFTICNENTMNVFYGVLHQTLQGWFDPVLTQLKATETSVQGDYQVSYQGRLAAWLGLSDRADQIATRSIQIEYRYPRTHLMQLGQRYVEVNSAIIALQRLMQRQYESLGQ
jgi:hypothetical protein